jgi:DNA repair exonuclease SbcCD ATPase subunit
MKFHRVQFKNFLSFGNTLTEFRLDQNKVILIKGTNGNGKSSVMEAIYFAFCGKPYRNIPKGKLVNNINKKNLLVILEFEHLGNEYKIKRGIKPNVFEIYKNDELVNEDSNIKDYQKQLESMIGIDSKTFKQTIMISSRFYTPFLSLTKAEKRDFIENIFSIKVFSEMNDYLKKKNNILKQKGKELEMTLGHIESNIEIIKEFNEKQLKQIETKKADITKVMSTLEEDNLEIQDQIQRNNNKLSDLNSKIQELQNKIKQKSDINKKLDLLEYKIQNHDEKIRFYSNTNICQTCEQEINKELANKKIKEEQDYIQEKKEQLNKIEKALKVIQKIEKQIQEISNECNTINSENITLQNNIKNNKNKIQELKSEYNEIVQESNLENNDIESYYAEHKKTKKDLANTEKMIKYINQTLTLISEKGVKKYIIDKYIPILNQSLNEYLQIFEASFSVMFDSEMQETVIAGSRGDLTYENLSSGEKQRLDSALLFSFLDLCKNKNSVNVNLLFMDEVLDQSLDQNGIDGIMSVFKTMKQRGYSIFVVSHKANAQENFDQVININKKRFSEITYE